MDVLVFVLVALIVLVIVGLAASVRVVKQIERGVVFRLGRVQREVRQPGLTLLMPLADRMKRVNMQVVTMPVPAQDGITCDNVTVRVDAVVYFRVIDPKRAVIEVQDYQCAISRVRRPPLRSIIGKSELDDLPSSREHLNQGLEVMLDSPAALAARQHVRPRRLPPHEGSCGSDWVLVGVSGGGPDGSGRVADRSAVVDGVGIPLSGWSRRR